MEQSLRGASYQHPSVLGYAQVLEDLVVGGTWHRNRRASDDADRWWLAASVSVELSYDQAR